jgi:ferredoxin-NADP reductase
MAIQTMELETNLKEIIRRTQNVKSFRFPRPASLNYKAGQFMFVTIRNAKGEMKKHFTMSSSPTEKDFIEFTKKLTGSDFSNALDALKLGDWVKIKAPFGSFTFEGKHNKIGMLSGGIGITPLRSICRFCTDMKLETKITLIYGNHSEGDIIFGNELKDMQKTNKNLQVIFTLTEPSAGWNGHTGRINKELVTKEIPDYIERIFYTCGPPAMVNGMSSLLRELNVPEEQILAENFPGY